MKNKIVLYTATFGGYDGLIPQPRCKGIDRICFTDKKIHSLSWDVKTIDTGLPDPSRSSRIVKILPHRYLQQYEISIYIDANFIVVCDLNELIENVLSNAPMAAFDHNQTRDDKRNCVYKEYDALLANGKIDTFKDDPLVMKMQVEKYKNEGYPLNNGLISGGVLIRKHNHPHVIRTMERWWQELSNGSRRDQLSFNYSAWKENFTYSVIDGDIRNNKWFYMIGIHRRSYFWKVFRYKARKLLALQKKKAG